MRGGASYAGSGRLSDGGIGRQGVGARPAGRRLPFTRARDSHFGCRSRSPPTFRAGSGPDRKYRSSSSGIIDLTENRDRHGGLALVGFAISSSGGPLALASIYLIPSTTPPRLEGVIALAGLLLFLAPLSIWLGFTREIASSGGLYSFVREATGRKIAVLHGILWSVSYLLYLPFTVADIVYLLLPEILAISPSAARLLEIGIPVVITATIASGKRGPVYLLAGLALAQLVVLALFVMPLIGGTPSALGTSPIRVSVRPLPVLEAVGGTSLLFVCSSLVLYLGGEAKGDATAIRKALVRGLAIVVALAVPSAFAIGRWLTPQIIASAVPGYALALQSTGRIAAVVVGIASLASLAGLVIAEYLALIRLWGAMLRFHWRRSTAMIGAFFIAADAVSLIDPARFYAIAIVPSLAALYASQLIVFLVYPRFRRKHGGMRLGSWLAVVVAVAWALYGLYIALAPSPPSGGSAASAY